MFVSASFVSVVAAFVQLSHYSPHSFSDLDPFLCVFVFQFRALMVGCVNNTHLHENRKAGWMEIQDSVRL